MVRFWWVGFLVKRQLLESFNIKVEDESVEGILWLNLTSINDGLHCIHVSVIYSLRTLQGVLILFSFMIRFYLRFMNFKTKGKYRYVYAGISTVDLAQKPIILKG